ncbi:hypothetical protein [Kordiimonas aestuarii]|uniref:hypothetical protein n=1 Tax=Kordiimonas aestuarii TaxID=1005925 RepID=UPI0021CF2F1A|nr:hypothetical protein [Kordiimonas aestuarii]
MCAGQLELNANLLKDPLLYICFRNTTEGVAVRDAFDEAFDPKEAARTFSERRSEVTSD